VKNAPFDQPLFEALPLADGRGLRLRGELDMSTAGDLLAMLDGLPRDRAPVLDLAELSFLAVAGLHALEQYARSLDGARPLVLENVPPQTRRLFEIVGADSNPGIELRSGGG
jgi:anti-anti-sigma factor